MIVPRKVLLDQLPEHKTDSVSKRALLETLSQLNALVTSEIDLLQVDRPFTGRSSTGSNLLQVVYR